LRANCCSSGGGAHLGLRRHWICLSPNNYWKYYLCYFCHCCCWWWRGWW